jgi:hypothetical protein
MSKFNEEKTCFLPQFFVVHSISPKPLILST